MKPSIPGLHNSDQIPDDPVILLHKQANLFKRQGNPEGSKQLDALAEKIESQFGHTLEYGFALESGARLSILSHPWGEQRWGYKNTYCSEETVEAEQVVVDWSCYIYYHLGQLQPFVEVWMHIIFPARLGQQYWLGVDISPGAKTFFVFHYDLADDDTFRLTTIQKGAKVVADLSPMWATGAGLVKTPELPFPLVLADRITREYSEVGRDGKLRWLGRFEVKFPFRTEDGQDEVRSIYFDTSLRKSPQT